MTCKERVLMESPSEDGTAGEAESSDVCPPA